MATKSGVVQRINRAVALPDINSVDVQFTESEAKAKMKINAHPTSCTYIMDILLNALLRFCLQEPKL